MSVNMCYVLWFHFVHRHTGSVVDGVRLTCRATVSVNFLSSLCFQQFSYMIGCSGLHTDCWPRGEWFIWPV